METLLYGVTVSSVNASARRIYLPHISSFG